MKTMHSIYMDYQKALHQADVLERSADNLRAELSRLKECRSQIRAYWKGQPAREYIRKLRETEASCRRMKNNLIGAAGVIRGMALETYRAEQRAIELAQKRLY